MVFRHIVFFLLLQLYYLGIQAKKQGCPDDPFAILMPEGQFCVNGCGCKGILQCENAVCAKPPQYPSQPTEEMGNKPYCGNDISQAGLSLPRENCAVYSIDYTDVNNDPGDIHNVHCSGSGAEFVDDPENVNGGYYVWELCEECGFCEDAPPTKSPSLTPSKAPTAVPSQIPSKSPDTPSPSAQPTPSPTAPPTFSPSTSPSENPTPSPTLPPSTDPSTIPSAFPTRKPSRKPSDTPSRTPTPSPTSPPTPMPSRKPTTSVPTSAPTKAPLATVTVTLDMECPDDLETFKAELASEIAKLNDQVSVQDVACGSVIITLVGDDPQEVSSISDHIVDTGVSLPTYGQVGGQVEPLEEKSDEKSSSGAVIAIVVIVLVLVILGAIWFIGKHIRAKKDQEKEAENQRDLWSEKARKISLQAQAPGKNGSNDIETPTAEKQTAEMKTPGEQNADSKLNKPDPTKERRWMPTSTQMKKSLSTESKSATTI